MGLKLEKGLEVFFSKYFLFLAFLCVTSLVETLNEHL
jgi:hypothetical protein